MLSSIHPLGERARNNRWWLTVTAFVAAAVATGTAAGGVLGWAGSWLPTGDWRWPAALAVVVAAGIADLAGVRPAGPRRQVDDGWIGTYRGWVYGAGFGAQLGLGVSTYVVTWGVWATGLLALLSGDLAVGGLIGAAFGIGRSLGPLTSGWIDRPSRLTSLNRTMASWSRVGATATGSALLVLGVVGIVAGVL